MLSKEKQVPQETDSFCLSLNILPCIYKQACDSPYNHHFKIVHKLADKFNALY